MSKPHFIEFPSQLGGIVWMNAEVISLIIVGTPEQTPSGIFVDPVYVYYKRDQEPDVGDGEKLQTFYIDDEQAPQWVSYWRSCLGVPELWERG